MYLKRTKTRTGRTYVSITQSYRDENGAPRSRTVQSLGYLDELEREHEDALAYCHKVKAELERQQRDRALSRTFFLDPSEQIGNTEGHRKNLGAAAYGTILRELGVDEFLRNHSSHAKLPCSAYKVLCCMVYTYLTGKKSWERAWKRRNSFFESFDFSRSDMFQIMDFLAKHTNELQQWVCDHLLPSADHATTNAYLPVVNFAYDERGDGIEDDETGQSTKTGYDLFSPIIQISALMDVNRVPLGINVYFGRDYESRIHERLGPDDLLDACKEQMPSLKRIVVIADKGPLAQDESLFTITKSGGYVFGQSPLLCEPEEYSWIANPNGYGTYTDDEFRAKTRTIVRRIRKTKNGNESRRIVPEKQVALWSRRAQNRERARRASIAASLMRSGTERKLPFLPEGDELSKADGYQLIVTSETREPIGMIVSCYQLLNHMRSLFSLPYKDLQQLPASADLSNMVRAHFLICYLAGVVTEVIRLRTGSRFSVEAITDSLGKVNGTQLDDTWYAFSYRNDITDTVGETLGLDFSRKYLSKSDARQMFSGHRREPAEEIDTETQEQDR